MLHSRLHHPARALSLLERGILPTPCPGLCPRGFLPCTVSSSLGSPTSCPLPSEHSSWPQSCPSLPVTWPPQRANRPCSWAGAIALLAVVSVGLQGCQPSEQGGTFPTALPWQGWRIPSTLSHSGLWSPSRSQEGWGRGPPYPCTEEQVAAEGPVQVLPSVPAGDSLLHPKAHFPAARATGKLLMWNPGRWQGLVTKAEPQALSLTW